jgi:cation transport regulator ChaB
MVHAKPMSSRRRLPGVGNDLLIAAVRSNVRSKDRRKQEKREKSCAHRVSRTAYKRAKES